MRYTNTDKHALSTSRGQFL